VLQFCGFIRKNALLETPLIAWTPKYSGIQPGMPSPLRLALAGFRIHELWKKPS
jgi:hypothetical protein